jgi:hypothetical protein
MEKLDADETKSRDRSLDPKKSTGAASPPVEHVGGFSFLKKIAMFAST